MDFKDYYAVMGVARDATQDEIKRAYRKLARKYHPDVSKEAGAEQRFKAVGEAFTEAGKKVLPDQNGPFEDGYFPTSGSHVYERRVSAAVGYLDQPTLVRLFGFEKDLTATQVAVNTLDRPVLLDYYLDGWRQWGR